MFSFINPDKMLNPITMALRVFGLWGSGTKPSQCYQIYGIFVVSFYCVFTFFMVAQIILLDDKAKLAHTLSMPLIVLCGCLKFIYFVIYNKELQELVQHIRRFRLESDEERALVNGNINGIYIVAIIFTIGCMSSTHVNVITIANLDHPALPFAGWYPFWDWQHCKRDYYITLTYQYIGINTSVLLMLAVEMFFTFMLLMSGIIFEIIGKRIKRLGKATQVNACGKIPHGLIKTVMNKPDESDILINCVQQHLNVLALKEKIEKLMSFSYMCQMLASAISISACAALVADGVDEWVSYIIGVIVMTMEIFFPCYFADKTIEMSRKLPTQLYKSNWINLITERKTKRNFKSMMLIFMGITQRETIYFVGRIFPLSLQTFSAVVNTAYRIFAILNK